MTTSEDYRSSHLQRGGHYDATLAEVPFDAYMAAWEKKHLERVVQELFPSGVPRYLDFACGTGRATTTVAPFARETVGVDISPSMLAVAQGKLPNARFVHADITTQEADIGEFDLVTSFRFFGNAQHELREAVMRVLTRHLRPGGRLIINSHRNPQAIYSLLDRLTGGNAGSMDLHLPKLRKLLEGHGMRVEQLIPIGAWMFRSRMLNAFKPDDPVAIAKERSHAGAGWARWAPDCIVVARKG